METNPEMITIPVKLDEKTFRRFAYFDMFILRKKWIRPVVFFLIMTAFAFAALAVLVNEELKRRDVEVAASVEKVRYLKTSAQGEPLVWFL